jgi:hypothetical protein
MRWACSKHKQLKNKYCFYIVNFHVKMLCGKYEQAGNAITVYVKEIS